MKFKIKHEIRGRIHVHILQNRMSDREADILQFFLSKHKLVTAAKVYSRTCDASISYVGDRNEIIKSLCSFDCQKVDVPDVFLENSGRELNEKYKEKLVMKVVVRYGSKIFVPYALREIYTLCKSTKYIYAGVRTLLSKKIEVPVLDAVSIGTSILRNDIKTAGSVMFMLGIGETLEEWTHKKSVDDLARSMSLNVENVWLSKDDTEVLVPIKDIKTGDNVVVYMGHVIPFDGVVASGEAMINQASMTGESIAVHKTPGAYVYAGTVVEEGEVIVSVKETTGSSRFEKIVSMIEESEKLKSSLEGKAEHLADRLVPYTLGGAGLVYLLTRNVTKAVSVLMVDFSCALKLAMPIAVLSAIREASLYNITVKGGKYLEAMEAADTIVFDKTGTLTKAKPTVADVITFNDKNADEMLRIAACLEEHFPHSMAKAVVDAAKEKKLEHEEMHTKVEYIVAHGIVTTIDGRRTVIGSYHFVFEDEGCHIPKGKQELFDSLPKEYSHLYLAIENMLEAVICIEDPIREEASAVINSLKRAGIKKVVMMTGDSERTASAIAKCVGVDEYYSEVLPEDKARYIENEKAAGRKVVMIGDGINDSPALSAADVGIAISDGAAMAREIADVTIGADALYEIVTLKAISDSLMKRINKNYRLIVGFNSGFIAMGVAGIISPTLSAMLHNASTIAISIKSMENLLE